MTTQRTTATNVDAVERLSRGFAGVFENPDSSHNVLAADVFVDLNMPVWRFQLGGAAAFPDQLQGINEGDGRIDVLRAAPTASGFVAEHEEHQAGHGQDLTARPMWLCGVRGGQ